MVRRVSWAALTGESPVRVSAGAPGSRLRSRGETFSAKWSDKSLRKEGATKQAEHKVNAAASSKYQPKGVWEGRAAHITAKATDSVRKTGMDVGPPRGRGRRHASTERDGTRETLSGGPRRAKSLGIRPKVEIPGGREGVRGAFITWEGGEKPLEGRGPASVVAATGVRARA